MRRRDFLPALAASAAAAQTAACVGSLLISAPTELQHRPNSADQAGLCPHRQLLSFLYAECCTRNKL
jgi:hypothetical protein